MSVKRVAQAWKDGKRATSGNMRTDGETVWSWRLAIGRTVKGRKVAIDYRGHVSGSTTRHCNVVMTVADETEEPTP